MRIKINIHPKTGELKLPKHYLRPLSAAVWRNIQLPTQKESGKTKLLVISPLFFKKRNPEMDHIRLIGNSGYLTIASALQEVLMRIGEMSGPLELVGNLCDIGEKSFVDGPAFEEEMIWATAPRTGIITKETVERGTGRFIYPRANKTKCEEALQRSLLWKWRQFCKEEESKAIRWCEVEDPTQWGESNPPQVEILKSDCPFQEKIKEGSVAMGWPGKVKITGHHAWQRLIWACGLGTKTGLGFGMVEPQHK